MHVFTLANPLELTKALAPDLFFMGGAMLLLLVAVWRRESRNHQRLVGAMSVITGVVRKAPIRTRNSPTKPFVPGTPIELSDTIVSSAANIGTARAMPPYDSIRRVWRRS